MRFVCFIYQSFICEGKMKRILFSMLILGSFTLLTAEQYGQYQPSAGDFNSSESSSAKAYQAESDYEHETEVDTSADRDLSKHVYESLYGYISNGNQNVAFEINEGVVTLTGNVNSEEDKAKIESDLKNIDGVKRVDNKIKVTDSKKVAYYQPKVADTGTAVKSNTKSAKDYAALDNDKKINAKIRDKLDNRGFAEVSIITANGVVTLGGFVNKSDEFVPVVLEIEKIEGVKKVNNKVSPKK